MHIIALDVRGNSLKLASIHVDSRELLTWIHTTLKERSCKFVLNVKTR